MLLVTIRDWHRKFDWIQFNFLKQLFIAVVLLIISCFLFQVVQPFRKWCIRLLFRTSVRDNVCIVSGVKLSISSLRIKQPLAKLSICVWPKYAEEMRKKQCLSLFRGRVKAFL